MPSKLTNFGLYFITDSTLTKKTVLHDVESAIKAGIKIIQYREKNISKEKMIEEAKKINEICKKNNVTFIVDDQVDVCLQSGADGVHLGQDDMPYESARKFLKNKIIGLTANSVEQAIKNQELGADYTSIGPIFDTKTKQPPKDPIGLDTINQLKDKLTIPFVAIGGINETNIDNVLKAGAKNIAMISAIVSKDNVEENVKKFINKIGLFH